MLNDARECLGMALKSLGYSANTTSQGELDQATEKLIQQKPLVSVYDSTNMTRSIVQGQWLVMSWDGYTLMAIDSLRADAQAENLVTFVRPTEGFVRFDDTNVCPVGNSSRYGAHLWMDYLMKPQVAGKNASWVWYLSPIAPASWEYTDEFALSLAPTADEAARCENLADVGEFASAYREAWRRIKSA